ncbi:MAG TPA: carboxypeptidase regulatory-like domain-containing protein, partial [Planctomycetota bacterium]|nr:carboxypeptidase regulatory-like domain-containing protein [Planctomycetota bacterium]
MRRARAIGFLAAAAAIAAAAGVTALVREGGGAAERRADVGRASGAAFATADLAATRAAAGADASRGAPALEADAAGDGARASEEPDPTRVATVIARFVDPAGEPVAGYAVEGAGVPGARVESGADGRFAWREPVPDGEASSSAALVARRKGSMSLLLVARLLPGETTHLGDVVAHPGGDLSGVVVDAKERPVPGAQITAIPFFGPRPDARWSASSAADGSFRIDGVQTGAVTLIATARAFNRVRVVAEVVAGEETRDVKLALEAWPAESLIRGRVVDLEGKPVPNALIDSRADLAVGGWESLQLMSDDDGTFVQLVSGNTSPWRELTARDPRGALQPSAPKRAHAGGPAVELKLQPAKTWWLEVRDASGAPIEEYRAWTVDDPERWRFRSSGGETWIDAEFAFEASRVHVSGRHAEGRAEISLEAEAFYVMVDAPGFALGQLGPLDPAAMPALATVRLLPAAFLRGRVTSGAGPVAGARVRLIDAVASGMRSEMGPFRVRMGGYPWDLKSEARTDATGAYRIPLKRDGTFFVRAEADGLAPDDLGPFDLERAKGRDGVDLKLTRGGALEGRVLFPEGREPTGLIVGISRGDGFPLTKRV